MPVISSQTAATSVAMNMSRSADQPSAPSKSSSAAPVNLEDTEGGFRRSLRRSLTIATTGSEREADGAGEEAPRKEIDQEEWDDVLEDQGLGEKKDTRKLSIVERPEFDMGIGSIISLNAIFMGVECDHKKPGGDMAVWIAFDNFFCLVWVSEFFIKLHYLRLGYFRVPFNVMDFLLVLLSINDAWIMPFVSDGGANALGVLSMVRILRILRLLRLLRLMKMFRNLWLIIVGFSESLSTLYWVLLLMSIIVYIFGVFLRSTIDCDGDFSSWDQCNTFFGTMPATMYTLVQVITLESWSQAIARPVLQIQPVFFIVFLLFLFLTTFGMLNIIVGVIVENTLNAAKQNQDLQDKRAQKQLRHDLEALRIVFEEADVDGSGTLEIEEFEEICKIADVKRMMQRMEIPMSDPSMLFEIMDEEGSGSITFALFTQGVLKVKGPPSGLDMKTMQVGVTGINRRLQRLEESVSCLQKMAVDNERTNRLILQKLGIVDLDNHMIDRPSQETTCSDPPSQPQLLCEDSSMQPQSLMGDEDDGFSNIPGCMSEESAQ
eukprot:TRINITY_DN22705_c0_g1_i1.p1 TRINITY_DN22705_c0_g1~~TRINITY_DN22705_c0_g1_i1.p1  ORF type:complete len:547 (+),score=112.88 TRINITY_DN22705_c0_g1_i1:231-1871(+)